MKTRNLQARPAAGPITPFAAVRCCPLGAEIANFDPNQPVRAERARPFCGKLWPTFQLLVFRDQTIITRPQQPHLTRVLRGSGAKGSARPDPPNKCPPRGAGSPEVLLPEQPSRVRRRSGYGMAWPLLTGPGLTRG
jgi:hypothetical protein